MSVGPLIKWLHDCYRDDRTRSGVKDFYAAAVMHRRMTRSEEKLLTGLLDSEHVAPSYLEKALPYTQLHRRERDLVYGALFVCGKSMEGITRAPLVIMQASLDSIADGVNMLTLAEGSWRLNPSALEVLQGGEELENRLSEIVAQEILDYDAVGQIRTIIDQCCDGVDTKSLFDWPYLAKAKDVEDAGKESKFKVISACGLANIKKSISSRGVLDELLQMGGFSRSQFSAPLLTIFGDSAFEEKKDHSNALFVPATLSEAQEKILRSARKNKLTVCHGPPGTGKSFTIAAIALDHVARGENVLVVSRSDHAVDVVHQKIDEMLDAEEATVRAGRKNYLRDLKSYLEVCLSGRTVEGLSLVNLGKRELEIEAKISEIQEVSERLESEFGKSIAAGAVLAKPVKGLLDRIRIFLSERAVNNRPLLAEMAMYLEQLHSEREAMVREYGRLERLCRLAAVLDRASSRKELKNLLRGLRKLHGSKQEEIFKEIDFDKIFGALPVWLTKCEDVHRVLPMRKELFDVVVIDEASQCDLASVIPLIQRAKRVVVAGDAKQLRHISFLPEDKLAHHSRKAGITEEQLEKYHYRNRSLMNVATDQVQDGKQTGFLDEHFRSHQSIISFSNKHFYYSTLKVMKEKPWLDGDDQLVGEYCKGFRNDDGVNHAEINSVIKCLRTILQREKGMQVHTCTSLGILSPFRAQVDAMWISIQEQFDARDLNRLLNAHKLLIGTAHTFQGEERDVMLLSLVIDSNSSISTRRFLEREDVFNVSITRAKNRQWVFHSVQASELPHDSLVGNYLLHVHENMMSGTLASEPCIDQFANEVAEAFSALGLEVIQEGVVAGLDVDLVLLRHGKALGIDLVGYPGVMTEAVAQRKAQLLGRAGMRVLPLGYVEWSKRKADCLSKFADLLGINLPSS